MAKRITKEDRTFRHSSMCALLSCLGYEPPTAGKGNIMGKDHFVDRCARAISAGNILKVDDGTYELSQKYYEDYRATDKPPKDQAKARAASERTKKKVEKTRRRTWAARGNSQQKRI